MAAKGGQLKKTVRQLPAAIVAASQQHGDHSELERLLDYLVLSME